ncbi:uroporphyrinogen-III synthase [Bacterioplanes sanyensis]|uniref:Uroporphyrinogen-III synthase n=1 Tax=Bacterioplanes sanyensis TaxID=1249553 RepID=A0A222FFR2_9GAMM|nr:uroporphyrinogen-III synthase [Bacterioplanes sanyensis]ASP37848.1 uroporphyrinogen-III synthase [Bacterioplanes sanyensis]
MQVVVTRPAGQQQALMEALSQLGVTPLHRPLMRIEALASNATLRQSMIDLDHYQAVIAISRNAAEHGLRWMDEFWPQPPVGIDWYAVGPTTAEVLQQAGLRVRMPMQQFDSEGLLALASLSAKRVTGTKVLIWRGVGGRETLASVLRQRGAQVDYAELYQRLAVTDQDWPQVLASRPLLLLSSSQALDIVSAQVPDLAQRIAALVVPSERAATQARAQGITTIQAASARDEDMLASVGQWLHND